MDCKSLRKEESFRWNVVGGTGCTLIVETYLSNGVFLWGIAINK